MIDNSNNGHQAEDYDFEQATPEGIEGFERLGEFLEEDGWDPEEAGDDYAYTLTYDGDNGELACYAQVRVDLEQFVFYVMSPVRAAPEALAAAAEFVTRANYGLRIGNFELNYADGAVRFKSSLDFEGVGLSFGLLRNVIYPAVEAMDDYLPGLREVIDRAMPPLDAIQAVESGAFDVGEVDIDALDDALDDLDSEGA